MGTKLPCISRAALCVSPQTDVAKFAHAPLSSEPLLHIESLSLQYKPQ